MDLRSINNDQKEIYNKHVTHVMQSWEWGEFRKSLGTKLLRYGLFKNNKLQKAFQLTFHQIPLTSYFVGYLPKGPLPDQDLAKSLEQIGREQNCAFIKLEPDILNENKLYKVHPSFQISPKPLFTKHNFILDLTQSEEELLKNMHPKTRYNIRLAEKKGIKVEERTDEIAFKIYLKLYFETTQRQGYHGHSEFYHQKVWETLKNAGMARLLIGFFHKKPLTAWMLLSFKDILYYPYGGSSNEHREFMHSNLVAWEAIKLGKKLGLKKFDMWGALGPDASPNDPWQGFHRFKAGFGGKLVEYIGTFDIVFNPALYFAFTFFDKNIKLKSTLLKIFK